MNSKLRLELASNRRISKGSSGCNGSTAFWPTMAQHSYKKTYGFHIVIFHACSNMLYQGIEVVNMISGPNDLLIHANLHDLTRFGRLFLMVSSIVRRIEADNELALAV